MSFAEVKLKGLKDRYAALLTQYEAEGEQLRLAPLGGDRVRREGVVKEIENELIRLEGEIEAARGAAGGVGAPSFDLLGKFPHIDFVDATEKIGDLLKRHRGKGFHQMLVIEDGYLMGGEWCLRRITWEFKERAPALQVYPYRIGLGHCTSPNDLLREIAKSHTAPMPTGDDPAAVVAALLCGLAHNSARLFEFRVGDDSAASVELAMWVVERFWRALGEAVAARADLTGVRSLAALHFDDPAPPGLLARKDLDVLDIKLCEEDDVREWLSSHAAHPCVQPHTIPAFAQGALQAGKKGGYPKMLSYFTDLFLPSGKPA